MPTSAALNLDLDQLAQRFFDLQKGTHDNSGWDDKGHQALYFISAGSEYRLWQPKAGVGYGPLGADTIAAYQQILGDLQQSIEADLTGERQADALARVAAAQAEFAAGGAYATLQIDATLDHIRGAQEDDHAGVSMQVFWSDALGIWLPDALQLGFTWATEDTMVPPSLFHALGWPPYIRP